MATVIIPENLPVGYRFHPTDEELVDHYLKLKVLGFRDNICIIPEVDICKWEPWELAQRFKEQSIIPSDDKVQEWWFFCPQMQRIRRSTRLGYWKKTGVDRTIKTRDKNRAIGTKKTLVFHEGRSSKGIKTNWVVHEYHLLIDNLDELFPNYLTKNYVLCRLKNKGDEKSDTSTIQLTGGAIGLSDLDSELHQPEHYNPFQQFLIQAAGNPSMSLVDTDADLHQPEHENSLAEHWSQTVGNSPTGRVDLRSDLHQPQHENSFPEGLIRAFPNSGSVTFRSDRHQPQHENSFQGRWIQEVRNSSTEPSLQQDNWSQAVGNSPTSTVDLRSDLHQPQHENSSPEGLILAFRNSGSVTYRSNRHQPQHENSFPGRWIQEVGNSSTEPSLQQDNWSQAVGNSPTSTVDLRSDLHQPQHENSFPEGLIRAFRNSGSATFRSDRHQPQHENSFPGRWIQEVGNSSTEPSLQQDNGAQFIRPFIQQFQSENVDLETNIPEPINTRSPSFAAFSWDNGDAFMDESDQLPFDYYDRDQLQTQYGPTCASNNDLAMRENRRTQTIESLHGVVPLDEKKGFIENKFNELHISPKHIEPPIKPEIGRTCSTDEESRVEKVEKLKLAATNIKPECVTLDELEAKAKGGESREDSAASNSPQNKHSNGIEQTLEKSNSMTNLRGTITECTRVSTVPPPYGQTSSSHSDHATVENCLTSIIELPHSQTSSSQEIKAMLETQRTQTIELSHGRGVVPLEKKKSFVGTESNSLSVLPKKPVEPLEMSDEDPSFEKVKKQELAARNIKPDCISLDDLAAKAKSHNKHVLAGNLQNGTVEPLNGAVCREKKKGLIENKSNSSHISSPKEMGLPETHVGVSIHRKDEPVRFEKLRKQDLAARNIKPEYVPLDESAAKAEHDQSGFHMEHMLDGAETFAILSIVNLTSKLVFLIFSSLSPNLRL